MLARQSVNIGRVRLARSLATSAVTRKDLVQDVYLRELKAYKAPPPPKDAHVGVVKPFNAPSAPKPPSTPTDFATELASYDSAEPGGGPSPSTQAGSQKPVGEQAGGAREFLQFLEADFPKEEAHH